MNNILTLFLNNDKEGLRQLIKEKEDKIRKLWIELSQIVSNSK